MELFKYAEKMYNPAVILQSILSLKQGEWKAVYAIAQVLAKKLSQKLEIPLNVTFLDLLDKETKCPGNRNGEHELAPSELLDEEIKPKCYMCIHCLQKFNRANFDVTTSKIKTTFFSKDKK